MLSRELALDEARKQKEALAKIGGWRRILFLLTASLTAAAVLLLKTGGGWFVPGVAAAVLGAASLALTLIVDLSIRNGHRNVDRILDSLRQERQ